MTNRPNPCAKARWVRQLSSVFASGSSTRTGCACLGDRSPDSPAWECVGGCLASAAFLHSTEGHSMPQRRVNGTTGTCPHRPGRVRHAGVAVIHDFLVINPYHQEGIVSLPLLTGSVAAAALHSHRRKTLLLHGCDEGWN